MRRCGEYPCHFLPAEDQKKSLLLAWKGNVLQQKCPLPSLPIEETQARKRSGYRLTTPASFPESGTVGTDECAPLRADRESDENVRRMRRRAGGTIEWFPR